MSNVSVILSCFDITFKDQKCIQFFFFNIIFNDFIRYTFPFIFVHKQKYLLCGFYYRLHRLNTCNEWIGAELALKCISLFKLLLLLFALTENSGLSYFSFSLQHPEIRQNQWQHNILSHFASARAFFLFWAVTLGILYIYIYTMVVRRTCRWRRRKKFIHVSVSVFSVRYAMRWMKRSRVENSLNSPQTGPIRLQIRTKQEKNVTCTLKQILVHNSVETPNCYETMGHQLRLH